MNILLRNRGVLKIPKMIPKCCFGHRNDCMQRKNKQEGSEGCIQLCLACTYRAQNPADF